MSFLWLRSHFQFSSSGCDPRILTDTSCAAFWAVVAPPTNCTWDACHSPLPLQLEGKKQVHRNKHLLRRGWESPKEGGIKRLAIIRSIFTIQINQRCEVGTVHSPMRLPASYHQRSINFSPIMGCITWLAPPLLPTFAPTHAALFIAPKVRDPSSGSVSESSPTRPCPVVRIQPQCYPQLLFRDDIGINT